MGMAEDAGASAPKKNQKKVCVRPGKIVHSFSPLPDVVKEWLEFQKWYSLLNIDEVVYEELVVDFYKNLSFEKNERNEPSITSKVNNQHVELTVQRLSEWFLLSTDGHKQYTRHSWIFDKAGEIVNCLNLLHHGAPHMPDERPKKENLLVEHQALLEVLKECIIPTCNNHKTVGVLECAFLYLVASLKPVSLPHIILHHMNFSRSESQLPYGMLLTAVFKKHNLSLSCCVAKLVPNKYIDEKSLRNSGIYQVNGRFLTSLEYKSFLTYIEYKSLPVESNNQYRTPVKLPPIGTPTKRAQTSSSPTTSEFDGATIMAYLKGMEERLKKLPPIGTPTKRARTSSSPTPTTSEFDGATIMAYLKGMDERFMKEISKCKKKMASFGHRLSCLQDDVHELKKAKRKEQGNGKRKAILESESSKSPSIHEDEEESSEDGEDGIDEIPI